MSFAPTKEIAKKMRRDIKKANRCSCYVKLKFDSGYFVQDCPRNLCHEELVEARKREEK